MKPKMQLRILSLALLAVWVLLAGESAVWADSDQSDTYTSLPTVAITGGGPASYDISWVDAGEQTYYLADRTSGAGGRIDVIDAEHDTFLFTVGGFVGNVGSGISGPNGVVVIHRRNDALVCGGDEIWAGDGDSTVKVADLATRTVVATIPTGGTKRADEIGYDPEDHIILIANDDDTPPFVSFISTDTRNIVGKYTFATAIGLEQPVWDEQDKTFYISVPTTTANPGGEVDAVSPKTMTVTKVFPLTNCGPAGLALGPNDHLLVGCGATGSGTIVLDAKNGKVLATVAQVVGEDEVWYNSGDNRYYTASSNCPVGTCGGPVLGVIDAETNQWITNIPTAAGSHSVAANSQNNHIFVPKTNGGILVFTHSGEVDHDNGKGDDNNHH